MKRFRELGYLYVTLDLSGFQSGSGNLLLNLRRDPLPSPVTGRVGERSEPGWGGDNPGG